MNIEPENLELRDYSGNERMILLELELKLVVIAFVFSGHRFYSQK